MSFEEITAAASAQGFKTWAIEKGQKDAANLIEKDWERMVTFYRFPTEHWRHLRTSAKLSFVLFNGQKTGRSALVLSLVSPEPLRLDVGR